MMFVNVWNDEKKAIDRIGMYFSSNSFQCNAAPSPTLPLIPYLNVPAQVENPAGNIISDTLNWIEISGTFVASGNEQYLTIGNFHNDAGTTIVTVNPSASHTTNYFLIDDVSIEEVHSAQCMHDTVLCSPDSVLLGNNVSEAAVYNWSPATGLSCTSCPNPKAFVNQTVTYTLTKKQCKVTTTAQVKITIADTCNQVPVFTIPNVFTPNEDGTNDTFTISGKGMTIHSVVIYNRWGTIEYESELRDKKVFAWDGRTTSGEKASDGIYFYVVEYSNSKGEQLKKNGYVSLFK